MDARFALLLGCFLLSGFAALLYQTVWARELAFVFGTSELAVAAVLAAYMGGLALGSAAAARFAPRLQRPIRAYGLLELGIAVSALLVPTAIGLVDAFYVAWFGGAGELPDAGAAPTLFQLGGAFAVLLPPTALMGATLPLLARHAVRSDEQLGSAVGLLYAVNTAGAIAGTLCAAFWLIPELGLRRTVWVGAATNAAVFALAALLARGAPRALESGAGARGAVREGAAGILPAIALSGAVSFAYEVLWTRLLSHLLGASLHAFATMLASFLLGIALGSSAAARLATTRERARAGFAAAQLGIAVTSYASFALADRLPALARQLGAGFDAPLASAALAAVALLPITLFIGATFPFAVRILAEPARTQEAARATARVYSWNTVGAIAGALGAGFVSLPALGFEGTVAVAAAASLLLAAISALASTPRRWRIASLAVGLGVALAVAPPPAPWSLLRRLAWQENRRDDIRIVFGAVGRSSTVVLVEQPLSWGLATNGLPEAAIDRAGVLPSPSAIAYWLGLLPALVRPGLHDVLVVGLGGGSVIEAVPSSVRAIDVIELEPEVVAANRAIAAERARDPLSDPRVRVHVGDARGSLRLAAKRYGAIISQPSHPWTAGASHLYTQEFFSLVRSRLQPDGVFVQWIGLPFVDEGLLRSLASALDGVFGHVEMYGLGGGLLFAASAEPLAGLAGAAQALSAAPADYARFGLHRIEDFASAWLLDESGVRALAQGAAPITDDHNPLAARSARLGRAFLDHDALRALLAPHDPLLAPRAELERDALLRALSARGNLQRAEELARASTGAARERGLGWVDLARGRVRAAARRFAQARSLSPRDSEALVGLVASRRRELTQGPVPEIRESELLAPVAAVVASWRSAERGDWSAIAARDSDLARVAPGDALFREASRHRARWRVERGDPAASAEAVAILEPVLGPGWQAEDAELHARAAAAIGQHAAAWASLERIATLELPGRRGRDLARRALETADALPADRDGHVRIRLAQRAGEAGGQRGDQSASKSARKNAMN